MSNIYLKIIEELKNGTDLALATIVSTTGSTPQKPGSSAVLNKSGIVAGTIGGGAGEARILSRWALAIEGKQSALLEFDLKETEPGDEGELCGGIMRVLLDADPGRNIETFREMKESLDNYHTGIIVTIVSNLPDSGPERYWITREEGEAKKAVLPSEVYETAVRMLEGVDEARYREIIMPEDEKGCITSILLEPLFPVQRLVIAGAGHVGRALAKLACWLDFEVTVVDSRPSLANASNIPDVHEFIVGNVGEAFEKLKKDHSTFVVIATPGHKEDAEALKPCIGAPLAYLGMLGSKTKVARMKSNFIENGWATESQWEAIFTPVGLAIGSRSVEEIAVSIAAQLIMVRNSKASHEFILDKKRIAARALHETKDI